MFTYKFIPLYFLLLIPNYSFAISPIQDVPQILITPESGNSYMTVLSPVNNDGPGTVMTLLYDKNTQTLIQASAVSTWDSWNASPYDWNIEVGTRIPLNSVPQNTSPLPPGIYRSYICQIEITPGVIYDCAGQDWGYSSYPTYSQSVTNSKAYYVDIFIDQNNNITFSSFDSNAQTKFTGANLTWLASWIYDFDVTYFLDTSEFTSSNRPDVIDVVTNYSTAIGYDQVDGATKRKIILPLSDGNATTTFQFDLGMTGLGDYTTTVYFYNIAQGSYTFSETSITYTYTITAEGEFNVTSVDVNTSEEENNITFTKQPCGLTDLGGCLINAGIFLFIPSQTSYNKVTNLVSSSTLPFVANAYVAYSQFEASLADPETTDAIAYRFQVPQAGIDVEMFSASTTEYLMGDTMPVFRGLILLVFIVGFLTMLFTSINRMLFFTEFVAKK